MTHRPTFPAGSTRERHELGCEPPAPCPDCEEGVIYTQVDCDRYLEEPCPTCRGDWVDGPDRDDPMDVGPSYPGAFDWADPWER